MEPTSQFNRALEFVLRWEGGYVNDKDDPGGETKFGISKRAYPEVNIKELTREQAGEIYRRDYYDVFGCNDRPYSIALTLFDTAVNCGIARTAVWLDGSKDAEDVIKQRESHYHTLVKKKPLMGKYLKGWLNRLSALRKEISSEPPSSP